MGLLVIDGVLPSGIPVNNVYITFSGEIVYVSAKTKEGVYIIHSYYKVYKDQTKELDSNIRIQISTQVVDISLGVYHYLYEKLKQSYPNSSDIIEQEPDVVVPLDVAEIL
jgi:hypothetical protein